jgi:hypothetical protein
MASSANPLPGSTINPKTGKSTNGAGSAAVPGSGPSHCIVLIPNPVKGIPLIGDLVSSAGVCILTKTEARALIGGVALAAGGVTTLIGVSILIVSAFGHTKAGQSAAKLGGGLAEGVGAGLAFVPGAEAAGAAVAAGGSAIKRRQGAAGKVAQSTKKRRQGGRQEVQELQASGASNIRTAQKPQPRPTRPGRVIRSDRPEGRQGDQPRNVPRETSRQRSARMANPTGTGRHRKPATREEVGF